MRESAAVERAVALYMAGGLTIAAAAEAEGVSRSALIRALRRRGVEPGKPGRPALPVPETFEPYYCRDGSLLVREVTRPSARRRKP